MVERVRGVGAGGAGALAILLVLAMSGMVAGVAGAQEVAELPGQDRTLSPELEEVFRVGSFDGELWETFGEVRGVAFDAAGNLYVFDPQSSRVVVADPGGRFLREVGKEGEGPGELRAPVAFAVFRDGRIAIADMGHRAYVLYGADGAYQRMVSMGADGGMIRLGDLHPDPAGRGLLTGGGNMMISMRGGPGGGPETPETRPVELIGLEGETATTRTLVEGWRPPRDDAPTTMEGGGMRFSATMAGPLTFEPGLHVGALPDGGVAVVDSSTWSVEVAGPDGELRRVLRRPFPPRPVTEEIREAERERQLTELEEGEGPRMSIVTRSGSGGQQAVPQDAIREMMRGRIEQMQFYPELPVVMEMATGWNGRIWVQRRGASPTEPGPLDVATPEGRYVGTFATGSLPLPDAFGPDGLAAFVERDEYDVPTVVVRRLPAVLR